MYELSPILKNFLNEKGIKTLYPPQIEALAKGVLEGKSLVLASHTASGKTLIAELTILSRFHNGNLEKAVYMVPLKAIASEKYSEFKQLEKYGLRVALTTGDYDSEDEYLKDYDVIITTNEKFDSLLRHKPTWLNDINLVVVDEIHYIDDPKRGPVIESVLAKIMSLRRNLQILALSATVSNVEEIASWLKADYVISSWRPVPLKEGIYLNGKIFFNNGEVSEIKRIKNNPVLDLVYDTLSKNGQTLVFTNSRSMAEKLASKIASAIGGKLDFLLDRNLNKMLSEFENSSNARRLNEKLINLAANGVVFHHAGLTYMQRKIIENYFREGVLKVIVATPTLAAGVNLPARRVIIHSYRRYEIGKGHLPIKTMEYKQMSGRAGRPGFDEYGEAILIAKSEYEMRILQTMYINAKPESLFSKLIRESALRNFILSLIASEGAVSFKELVEVLKKTLYYTQYRVNEKELTFKLGKITDFLLREGFVNKYRELIEVTRFGKRVSELYIDPLTAIIYREFLEKANPHLTSNDEILFTMSLAPDMPRISVRKHDRGNIEYFLLDFLDEAQIDPYKFSFLSEYDIACAAKTTMLLRDWINEVSEDSIVEKYGVGPGDIFGLIETADWLLYSLSELAKIVSHNTEIITKINNVRKRVKYGVKEELLELVTLREVGRVRARALFEKGFKSINDLKKAKIEDLIKVPGIGYEVARKIVEQVKMK